MILATVPNVYVGAAIDDRGPRYRIDATPARIHAIRGTRDRLVVFSVQNFGMDPHDFAIKKVGVRKPIKLTGLIAAADGTTPGTATLRVRLRPGSYSLYCTILFGTPLSHARRGMRASFVVKAAGRRAATRVDAAR